MNNNWFDENAHQINNIIPYHSRYKTNQIPVNYKNIITDYHNVSDNTHRFGLKRNVIFKEDNENDYKCYTHKYLLNFTKEQDKTLKIFFKEALKVYNICVDIYKYCKEHSIKICTLWMVVKNSIYDIFYRFNDDKIEYNEKIKKCVEFIENSVETYKKNKKNKKKKEETDEDEDEYNEDNLDDEISEDEINENIIVKKKEIHRKQIPKPAPDDTLKGEVREFYKNYKTNLDKKKPFEMKYKNVKNRQTITISNRVISEDGICVGKLGKLNDFNYDYILNNYKINKECKLLYDLVLKKYYILVVSKNIIDNKNNIKKKEYCGIDPGEKTFMTVYSPNDYFKMGDRMDIKIIKYNKIIQELHNKLVNKKKNKKKLKIRIQYLHNKIKGFVNEIHKKSARYLCKNYENIFIPNFSTKSIISNDRNTYMNDNVKFVLQNQSHYKFRQYLKHCAKKYFTNVFIVDESYTSKTCNNCGIQSDIYDNRIKKCPNCNTEICRDVNGSRNITVKSLMKVLNEQNINY